MLNDLSRYPRQVVKETRPGSPEWQSQALGGMPGTVKRTKAAADTYLIS